MLYVNKRVYVVYLNTLLGFVYIENVKKICDVVQLYIDGKLYSMK